MPSTSSQRRRTRRPRAEREAQILAAARSAFAERGYEATSVSEIATRADVVEGTVYSYFESKRTLLIAVMKRFYEALIEDTESGLAAVCGSENRLRFIIRRHVQTFTADLGLCRVIIREARPDLALYDEAILELNRRYTGVALRVLEEGIRDGTFRTNLSPSIIRDLLYGGIEHAVWRFVFGDGEIDPGAVADQLATALLSGIRASPSRETEATVIRLERAVARLESRMDGNDEPSSELRPEAFKRGARER